MWTRNVKLWRKWKHNTITCACSDPTYKSGFYVTTRKAAGVGTAFLKGRTHWRGVSVVLCMQCKSSMWNWYRPVQRTWELPVAAWSLQRDNPWTTGWMLLTNSVPGWGVETPPKFRRPTKIVPNSTRLWKLLKIAKFWTPTPQDVRKKRQ